MSQTPEDAMPTPVGGNNETVVPQVPAPETIDFQAEVKKLEEHSTTQFPERLGTLLNPAVNEQGKLLGCVFRA
jgi:hypothetical protein